MVSLKRPIIFSLLLLIVIPAQNTIALTYLPPSSHYSGRQYRGFPGDWVIVEFAVYDNGGSEFTDAGYDLPESWATDPCDFIYAYQVINNVTSGPSHFEVDVFSISGIGVDAIDSAEANLGSEDDAQGGHRNEVEGVGDELLSAYWIFKPTPLPNPDDPEDPVNYSPVGRGEHSYFLLIKSDHNYTIGTFSTQGILGDDGDVDIFDDTMVVPNPEPGTLALFGLGSALLLKRQRKK